MKRIIIDYRMRDIEKKTLKDLGYRLIEINRQEAVYEEISSHVDIFCLKVENDLILEKNIYSLIKNDLKNINIIEGESILGKKYPNDIKYNVCIIGNNAIHNFKYTDKRVKEILKESNFNFINVNQGYTNCSIAVIDDNSVITHDKGIYEILKKHNFNILYLNKDLDIKLLNNKEYSNMRGFLGGCISRIENYIFVSGDLRKIDKENKIREFITSRNLKIIDFKDLDVVDYGGIIEI